MLPPPGVSKKIVWASKGEKSLRAKMFRSPLINSCFAPGVGGEGVKDVKDSTPVT